MIYKVLYASISKSKDFRFEFNNKYFIAENMNLEILEKEAKSRNFFSYVSSCAYIAERNVLSMCGRFDQICAKGLCLSYIIFNENDLEVYPVI